MESRGSPTPSVALVVRDDDRGDALRGVADAVARALRQRVAALVRRARALGAQEARDTDTATVTGTSFPFGGQSDEGVGAPVTAGGVASRSTETESAAVPPSLRAVQVSAVPAVSAATDEGA